MGERRSGEPLLAVEELRAHIDGGDETVRAVDGLSFTVDHGETVCLVGESGSGKTVACDVITGLHGAAVDIGGTATFDGTDLLGADDARLRALRGDRLAYVFQNAHNALDPVYTVGSQIVEAMQFHRDVDDAVARDRAKELLETVGLSRPEERVDAYPHELSDGMSQRVAVAIALAAEPELVIADEPMSALDVMIQARIVRLLDRLRTERDLALLLVTHDIRVVAALADRVVVLYAGTDVEHGPAEAVLNEPAHPYTQELFRSFVGDGETTRRLREESPQRGCRFARECPHVIDACQEHRPLAWPVNAEDHRAACVYHADERDSETVMADVTATAESGVAIGDIEGAAGPDPDGDIDD